MADGELRFDTKIDTDGASKGIRTLKGAFNSLIESFKNSERSLDNAFGGAQSNKITSLNAKISQTELQIQQLTAELQAMNNVGYTSKEFTEMQAEVAKAEASLINLINTRANFEESLKSDMIDLGFKVDDNMLKGIYESNLEWQSLTTQIKQAEVALNSYENELLSVKQADSTVNVSSTDQYVQKEIKLQGLIAKLENYKSQLGKTKGAEDKYTASTKKATKHTDKFSKSTSRANKSASKLSKAIGMLKMSLGLAVAFMAFQAVIEGIKKGFDNLAQYSSKFNNTLSSFMSAMTKFKNSIATAFAPLVTVAMPYIVTFINGMSKALDVVAQFMAALTGQSIYTKATAVQEDYAASLKDTAKAAKDASNSLYAFDELNVDQKNNDNSSTVDPKDMFTEGAIGQSILDAVNSFKALMADLFQPVQDAWNTYGQGVMDAFNTALDNIKGAIAAIGTAFYNVWTNGTGYETVSNILILLTTVLSILGAIALAFTLAWNDNGAGEALIQSIFDMLNAILVLINSIGIAFLAVWTNGTGQEMLGFILSILTNIFNTVTNLATQFTTAWNQAGTGTQIFQNIADVINTLLSYIDKITLALADWAGNIDFSPLLQSIQTFTASLEPLAGTIGEALYWFFTEVLMPIGSFVIEDALPVFFDLLGAAIEFVNSALEALQPLASWLWDSFLQPIASWTGGVIIDILKGLADALKGISDWISENQSLVEGMTITIAAFVGAWKVVEILSFIQQSGGLISALGLIAKALFGATAAKTKDIAETAILNAMYAGELLKSIASATGALIKNAAQWVATTAVKAADTIATIASTTATVAATAATWAFNAALAVLTSPITLVIGAIAALVAIIVLLIKNWDTVKEVMSKVWDAIVKVWEGAGDWFVEKVIEPIKKWFGDMAKSIKEAGIMAWQGIKDAFKEAGEWFMESVISPILDAFDFLWNGIKNIINGILGFIEGLVNGVIGGVNLIISALNSLNFDIPDWVPVVGGKSFGFNIPKVSEVKLPRLATGTVVPKSSGEFAAILGDNNREAEVVSPLSTIEQAVLNAMSRNKGSQEITIKFTGTLSELVRQLKPELDKENDRVGVTLIQGGVS